jgi:uncharacterized protein YbaA (DUF1428 family)
MQSDNEAMRGLITTKHLMTNAVVIISEFGVVTYLRCLAAAVLSRRHTTFLECVMRLDRSPKA